MEEKILKVGILGTGEMAGRMAASIAKMEHINLCAVASRNFEDACTFALKYDVEKAFKKYEDLMKDPEIDLIYIPSPVAYHAFYASQCISKKKPVLLEKTFTVNADQAEALIAKAEHEGVFITEAIQTRYLPMAKTLQDVIKSGRIGTVNSVSANIGCPISRKQGMLDPGMAGGALLELGIYPLTFIAMAAGTDVTDITTEERKSRSGVDLEHNILMTIKNGSDEIRCSFYSSIIGPTDKKGMVYGTEGYLVVGNITEFEYIEVYDKEGKLVERIEQQEMSQTPYVYELEACRKALQDGKLECEEIPHREMIKMLKIMDLIRRGMGVCYPFE